MRILCLTPWFPDRPGAQFGNFILDSLLAMKDQGHVVATMVCQPWRPAWSALLHEGWARPVLDLASHDPDLRVSLAHYPSIPRNYCRRFALWLCKRWILGPLQQRIVSFQAEILLVHTEQLAMVATQAAHAAGIPVVVVVHGVNTSARLNTPAERVRMANMLRAVDRVVLVGAPLWEPLAALVDTTERFRIVHNGVCLPPVDTASAPALAQRPLRLISVSNLVDGKGIDLNLEALARLHAGGLQDWQYTIIGGGDQASQLRNLARRLGIADKVHFTGAIAHRDVYAWLVQSSVFLLPSWQEAFGVAWLEAMACGLLAVGVAGQGPAAFITHDESGLLVAPHSIDSVVDCLQRIFAEPEALQRVARSGQAKVLEDFTWAAHARQLSLVCSEAVTAS
jgi:glycosyltransferase involved in cell wall biosynthesis